MSKKAKNRPDTQWRVEMEVPGTAKTSDRVVISGAAYDATQAAICAHQARQHFYDTLNAERNAQSESASVG